MASYVIQECHEKFDDQKGLNWGYFNVNKVGAWLSIKSLLNVMLDEENGVLMPFSYTSL